MHGEFLSLLFIITHRQTERWFKQMGDDYHSEDTFKFRRGQYFKAGTLALSLVTVLPVRSPSTRRWPITVTWVGRLPQVRGWREPGFLHPRT